MNQFTAKIKSFLSNYTDTQIFAFEADLPKSPFDYLFIAEKKLIIHCIPIHDFSLDRFFFQHLSNNFIQKGMMIVHLWEDIWLYKPKIAQSRLLSMLGKSEKIPARLTTCRRIDKITLDIFLNQNHLQGACGAKYKYGLFLPEKYFRVLNQKPDENKELLVAVASFGACLKKHQGEKVYRSHELIRFANLLSMQVVGGMDKLLQGFIREQKPDDIMTYADMDWSDGKSYLKLGFELVGQTPPLVFIWDDDLSKRITFTDDSFSPKTILTNAGNLKFVKKIDHDKN